MIKKITLLSGIAFVCLSISVCAMKKAENYADMTTQTAVYFEGIPYVGNISGVDFENGEPNGNGVFIDNAGGFSLKGTWKDGDLQGNIEVELADGSSISTKYKNNQMNGLAVRTYSDKSYMEYRYEKGIPTGRAILYNQDGKIQSVDRYYNSKLISEWCSIAQEVEYKELFSNAEEYQEIPIVFQGEVTDILDDKKTEYVVVKNKENHSVICNYENTLSASQKTLMPTLEVGDIITVYGFLEQLDIWESEDLLNTYTLLQIDGEEFDSLEILNELFLSSRSDEYQSSISSVNINNTDLYSSIPCMSSFYAEIEEKNDFKIEELDGQNAKEYDYENIVHFPMHYSYFRLSDSADLVQMTNDQKKNKCTMVLLKTGTNQMYYATFEYETWEDVPQVGEQIQFDSIIQGLKKLKRTKLIEGQQYVDESYLLIPQLSISDIY